MNRRLPGAGCLRRAFLACLALAVWAGGAEAGWLGLRNDLPTPVIVQGATVVNNVARPGRPHLLYPGEVTWDSILAPSVKHVVITDPKARNRVLYQGPIRCAGNDLFFSLRIDPAPPGRVLLVPGKVPAAPGKR